ncbi:CocE/NonD family hydrolase [Hymenobacter weizhouensis]|uniref:CocE/NonD family hydrolase n=1 Tax=Hymenobacter sp. YIM 151500-1 TaxID=2987689 RepID=UPI002225EF25|nr:CocE/NonD family hydrolase [Hymenobacter sp. YIM 151500-1]UYZ63799.1 nuclear transport factor 2 family protein [Hymenobacter sp. YIM 151500-1]
METQPYQPGPNRVTFPSEGETLVGTLFLPASYQPGDQLPVVLVSGPWTQVKEQIGHRYGQQLADLGLAALALDFRFYGESGGEPRQLESTQAKVRDLHNAVTFLQTVPAVQAEQVGILGVCAGASVVAYAAAADPRLRAVATVAAWLQHPDTTPLFYGGPEGVQQRLALAAQAQTKFEQTGDMDYVPAYDPAEGSGAAMFFPIDYYANPERGAVPTWLNRFAVVGWQEWLEMDAVAPAQNIRVPVQLVHSDGSALPQNVKRFFEALPGQKDLHWTEGEHTQFYDQEPYVQHAARVVADHFRRVFKAPAKEPRHPNAQLVYDFFQAFGTVDKAWFDRHLSPDFVWHLPGHSPISGDWHGLDGALNGIRATAMRLGNGKNGFELLDVFGHDGGAVSIHRDFYTGDDNHFDLRYVIHYRIADGRITELFEIPFNQYENDRFWNLQQQNLAATQQEPAA